VGTVRRLAVAVAALAFAPAATAAPLTVRATLDENAVQFGEPVAMHVVVLADGARVEPSSVRITADPGPMTVLSRAGGTRSAGGGIVAVYSDRVASCLSSACVAPRGDAAPALPAVVVTAQTRDGRTLHARAPWPSLQVRGRVTAADLARARPPFRVDTAPPPPSYAIRPALLTWLLAGAAIVLGLGALALLALQVTRRRASRVEPEEALERAVRLTREAESRPPADRRRAVGLLARVLAARGKPLAASASDLAWSRPAPEGEALAALAGDAEREGSA
jgi:hypothetical protein